MKKLLYAAMLVLFSATAAMAQRGETNGCPIIKFQPLSPQNCAYTVTVKAQIYNPVTNTYAWSATATVILGPSAGTALPFCLSKGDGHDDYDFVPGAYYFTITNSNVNMIVDYATNPPAGTVQAPKNCFTTSNCNTFFGRNTTNSYTLFPGCTVGGI